MKTRILQLSNKTHKTSNLITINAIFQNDDKIGVVYAVLTNPNEDIVLLHLSWDGLNFYKDYTTDDNPKNTNTFTNDEKDMLNELTEILFINITDYVCG